MPKPTIRIIWFGCLLLLLGFLIHVGIGSSLWYNPFQILSEVARGHVGDNYTNDVVWNLRLPRACYCLFVGGSLGICGAALQTLFRNPLAEPYVVGASSGAAIGGALTLSLGVSETALIFLKPVAGFITGLLTLALVLSISRRKGVVETPTLLLAGVVVSTMLSSLLSLIVLESGKDQGVLLRWLLGSMSTAFWGPVWMLAGSFVTGFCLLYRASRRLNALAVGEETAASVGVNVQRLRNQVLVIVTAMVAITVGPVGIIGFVGLVAPHIARSIVGVDLRKTLPVSAVSGALLLLLSDAIAQRGPQGTELPVGIVTAILGAPSLLILMRRR
jgi:iron complex transport system permease protein